MMVSQLSGYSWALKSKGNSDTQDTTERLKKSAACALPHRINSPRGISELKMCFSCTWYPNMKALSVDTTIVCKNLLNEGRAAKLHSAGIIPATDRSRHTEGPTAGSMANCWCSSEPTNPLVSWAVVLSQPGVSLHATLSTTLATAHTLAAQYA